MLVPAIDAANHSDDALFEPFHDESDGSFNILADDVIEAGSEVFISYGRFRSNGEFLNHYGFSILDRQSDCCEFDFTLEGDKKHFVRIIQPSGDIMPRGINEDVVYIFENLVNGVCPRLLTYALICGVARQNALVNDLLPVFYGDKTLLSSEVRTNFPLLKSELQSMVIDEASTTLMHQGLALIQEMCFVHSAQLEEKYANSTETLLALLKEKRSSCAQDQIWVWSQCCNLLESHITSVTQLQNAVMNENHKWPSDQEILNNLATNVCNFKD